MDSIIKEYDSFETMDLKDELLRGIFSYGFEIPHSQTIAFSCVTDIHHYQSIALSYVSDLGHYQTIAFAYVLERDRAKTLPFDTFQIT